MDYVEFRVAYNVLRALAEPGVRLHDGTTAQFPEHGSRDALCRLIDSTVISAKEAAPTRLEIRTDRDDLLMIDGSNYPRPEFAQLVPADERGELQGPQMYVW